MTELGPVAPKDRILSLDVVRGFALLGILAVNAIYFSSPWQSGLNPSFGPLGVDQDTLWSWVLMHAVFEFKCITLFSMLFGASLYLVGGERQDKARGAILRRRLFWLAVFGLIHGLLIWYGDILLHYAIAGFIVLLARSWRVNTLLIVGALLYLMAFGFQALFGQVFNLIPAEKIGSIKAEMWSPPPAAVEEVISAYQSGIVGTFQQNFSTWVAYGVQGVIGMLPRTIGVMMIGMALFKSGFFSGKSPKWVYWLLLAIGFSSVAGIAYQAWLNAAGGFDFVHMQSVGTLANAGLSILGSLGYASLFILITLAGWRWISGPLSAVGRMAFTNYIAQSLIMTTIFYGGRGLGLFGEVDRVQLWGIVVAVWVVQLIWSPLWLSRFEMGPLEWLWRRLSYGRAVKL